MAIPQKYKWLENEPAPRMLLEGLRLLGIREIVGKLHNPVILDWAKETGLESVYTADEIPWCGLAHAVIAKRAGKVVQKDPLWALNWANWGVIQLVPELGDTLTFKRPGGGHVGLYIAESKTTYHVMGGNQGNAYSIVEIAKFRLFSARRLYAVGVPDNVRRIFINASGQVSDNES